MSKEIKQKKKPVSIVQAYKLAHEQASKTNSPDDKIKAYAKVINFCAGSKSCRWNPSVKRNMLLYWANGNIAQALKEKQQPMEALKYWQKAIRLANDDNQKVKIWEKMLEIWGEAPIDLSQRCKEIIKISSKLSKIYMQKGSINDVIRLEKLKENVQRLMQRSED